MVKQTLHTTLTAAGYDTLPADPQKVHIADYLEGIFGDIEGRTDGWLITSIDADDYTLLVRHIVPALDGLVTAGPTANPHDHPFLAFECTDSGRTFWERWIINP